MSVTLYDEAIVKKIKSWTDITKLKIYGPDDTRQLFQVIADEQNDKRIELPLISITRPGGYTITNPYRQPMSYNALTVKLNDEQATKLNAIPIEINYQIDVYTRYMKEADAYTRELVFNIVNHPKIEIEIPYKDVKYKHDCPMWLSSNEIEDNTDTPQIIVRGNFYRMTLNVRIDNAYIWDVRDYKNLVIEPYVQLPEKENINDDSLIYNN